MRVISEAPTTVAARADPQTRFEAWLLARVERDFRLDNAVSARMREALLIVIRERSTTHVGAER